MDYGKSTCPQGLEHLGWVKRSDKYISIDHSDLIGFALICVVT